MDHANGSTCDFKTNVVAFNYKCVCNFAYERQGHVLTNNLEWQNSPYHFLMTVAAKCNNNVGRVYSALFALVMSSH